MSRRQIDRIVKLAGGINKLQSFREPTPLDKQSVILMNRDTLYSFAIVDISKGAKLTMPEADVRYNSAMIGNEMEYINKVFYEPGMHELTKDEFNTGYVLIAFRTLVDPSDPADIRKANELQDKFRIEAASANPCTHPNYDDKSYNELRDLLLGVAKFLPDSGGAFGSVATTQQVPHLLGAAFGWGGLCPQQRGQGWRCLSLPRVHTSAHEPSGQGGLVHDRSDSRSLGPRRRLWQDP
jgi:hypothetical protein